MQLAADPQTILHGCSFMPSIKGGSASDPDRDLHRDDGAERQVLRLEGRGAGNEEATLPLLGP